jgi:hypothetical protein
MPKSTRIQKYFKVNLLSHVSWPMTPAMAITTKEILRHTSLQVFDEKMSSKPTVQLHPKYNVQAILIFLVEILQLVLQNPNWP